jgi:L-seryl-tRNA(Ser) seleniumtransferase
MNASERVNAQLRRLPGVDRLISSVAEDASRAPWSVRQAAREVVEEARSEILRAGSKARLPDFEELVSRTRDRAAEMEQLSPRRVINATGIVLHTNLGRAPMASGAAAAVAEAASGYTDLEIDLATGERGSRTGEVSGLLRVLTGAEDAHVVNNNAAALLLAVDTLAAGQEVVLSRGELVEIGGSFRVPEIMAASRARLREVGTTNRTHPDDYARAVGPQTGALLKVHRSNFEIRGFTAEVSLAELAKLAGARGVPVIEDRGSGTFVDLRPYGIPESEAHAGLREGADLVLFSGDKLLGGPQAGIVLGRRDLVTRLRRSPLARALRVDKMTLAALDWTLRALLDGRATRELPVLRMLVRSEPELRAEAERLAAGLREAGFARVAVEDLPSRVGGGALPELEPSGDHAGAEGGASPRSARSRGGRGRCRGGCVPSRRRRRIPRGGAGFSLMGGSVSGTVLPC